MSLFSLAKFLIGGLLGLVLTVAIPQLSWDWLAIVVAYAYLVGGFFFGFVLLALLAVIYSAFSLGAVWQLALPILLALLVFRLIFQKVFLGMRLQVFTLILLIGVSNFIFWNYFFIKSTTRQSLNPQAEPILNLAMTLCLGVWILPAFGKFFAGLKPSRKNSMQQLSLFPRRRLRQSSSKKVY